MRALAGRASLGTFRRGRGTTTADGRGPALAPVSSTLAAELEELYASHRPALLAHCLRLTRDPVSAEDLVQESFARFMARRPALPRDVNALAYLRTTARNLWYRQLRDTRVVPVEAVEELAGASDDLEVDPERAALLDEQRGQVRRATARLGPRHREALALRELEDRSYAEVGTALATGEPAVAQLLFRARASLRREVRREQVDAAALPAACRSFLPALSAYVDGSATPAERGRVEAHLVGCPSCRDSLATFRDAGRRFRVGGPLAPLSAALGRIVGLAQDGPLAGPGVAVAAAIASVALAGGGLVVGHRLAGHATPRPAAISSSAAGSAGGASAAAPGGTAGGGAAGGGAAPAAPGGAAAAGGVAGFGPGGAGSDAGGRPGEGAVGGSAGATPAAGGVDGGASVGGAGATVGLSASGATVGGSGAGATVGVSGSGGAASVGASVPVGGSAGSASATVSVGSPSATVAATTPAVSTPAVTTPAVSTPTVSTPAGTVPAVTVPAVTVPSVTVASVTVTVGTPTVTLPQLP